MATDSKHCKLPSIGFVAGGPHQSNSVMIFHTDNDIYLAALPCFFASQGVFVCFKWSRSYTVRMIMPYVCKISAIKKKIHSNRSSLAWTLLKCKIEFWPIRVFPLKVSALSRAQPGRTDALLKYVTPLPHENGK